MGKNKLYPDDDGRTIADMSSLPGPTPFLLPKFRKKEPPRPEGSPAAPDRPWEKSKDGLSQEDRRVYVFAALRAALLIAGVFLIVFALVIWLLLKLWT